MDEELSDLFRNLGFAIVLIILFLILFTYVILHRFGGEESSIENKIIKQQDMILFIHQTKCDNCREIKKKLNSHMIYFDEINSNTEKRYQTILRRLNISSKDIVEPSILIIEKGNVVSILVDIQNMDDLEEFIEYNNLSN